MGDNEDQNPTGPPPDYDEMPRINPSWSRVKNGRPKSFLKTNIAWGVVIGGVIVLILWLINVISSKFLLENTSDPEKLLANTATYSTIMGLSAITAGVVGSILFHSTSYGYGFGACESYYDVTEKNRICSEKDLKCHMNRAVE